MSGKIFASAVFRTFCAFSLFTPLAPLSYAQQVPEKELVVPLPYPNPLRSSAQASDKPIAPPHPNTVETPDWSDEDISTAVNQCGMMLAGTGAVYKLLDPIREGRCGAPAPVELSVVGNIIPVKIHPPAKVTCGLAATLSAWMDFYVQPAARKHLGARITQISNVASYVCRNRYGSANKPLSEHALANAIDMAAFQTETGAWITVLDHWALPPVKRSLPPGPAGGVMPPVQSPPDESSNAKDATKPEADAALPAEDVKKTELPSEAAFLNEIHAGGCSLFGTVLGPRANEAHKNHYHYDMAARSNGNYCE